MSEETNRTDIKWIKGTLNNIQLSLDKYMADINSRVKTLEEDAVIYKTSLVVTKFWIGAILAIFGGTSWLFFAGVDAKIEETVSVIIEQKLAIILPKYEFKITENER